MLLLFKYTNETMMFSLYLWTLIYINCHHLNNGKVVNGNIIRILYISLNKETPEWLKAI